MFADTLSKLEAEATEGPWSIDSDGDSTEILDGIGSMAEVYSEMKDTDAALIVALRNKSKEIAALVETAEEALRHFTKQPSSLADTTVRGKLHAALAALEDK